MNEMTIPKLQSEIAEVEADLATRCTPQQAARTVTVVLGSYPQRNVNDAGIYTSQLTILLESYPASVVKQVAHPIDGVVARCKFLPTVAEVKEVADELTGQRRGRIARAMMDQREIDKRAKEIERERGLPSAEEREEIGKKWDALVRKTANAITAH